MNDMIRVRTHLKAGVVLQRVLGKTECGALDTNCIAMEPDPPPNDNYKQRSDMWDNCNYSLAGAGSKCKSALGPKATEHGYWCKKC
ncbi:MAG: hypothetical protein JW953_17090 [Anaerolineae bacterium]|nr:hypothetical protein [Anaerolineae bacterium]